MFLLILVTLLEIIYFINKDNYSYHPHTIIEEDRNYLGVEKLREYYEQDFEKCFIECIKDC